MTNKQILLDTKKKQILFAVIYGICLPMGYFTGQYLIGGILGGALGVVVGYFIGSTVVRHVLR